MGKANKKDLHLKHTWAHTHHLSLFHPIPVSLSLSKSIYFQCLIGAVSHQCCCCYNVMHSGSPKVLYRSDRLLSHIFSETGLETNCPLLSFLLQEML